MSNLTGLETETSFVESNFKTSYSYDKLFALARRLQTLILTEPNTIPNAPDCGVGIRLFLFNFNDETTINAIQESIQKNINKYLPNSNILNIAVSQFKSNVTGKTDGLLIKGDIYDKSDPDSLNVISQIGITFLKEKSSNIVSDIYL